MRGRVDVGTRRVDLAVDRKGGAIDDVVALDDLAVVVHQEQVGDADQAEVLAERIHPEVVAELGVARRDVPRRPLVVPELRPEAERRREPLLAVEALLFDGRERLGMADVLLLHARSLRPVHSTVPYAPWSPWVPASRTCPTAATRSSTKRSMTAACTALTVA